MARRQTLEEIEKKLTGGEPKFTEQVSDTEMMGALNWYSQNREPKQAQKYISDYIKKNKLKVAADVVSRQNSTFGFLCRMKSNGALFAEKHEETFQKYLKEMLEMVSKPVVEKEKKVVPNIQDRMAEKISEIAGELEGSIDEYILSGFSKMPSPYGIMHDKVKPMYITKLVEPFKRHRAEFDEVLTTKDEQLKEGYSNFTKAELKKLVAYCDQIIMDCMKIAGEVKQTRKPRKRKAKSPDQLVTKIKYCDKFDELKLVSVTPAKIIGAMQLWVYNTKTRKLGCYHAEDAGGLSVKGSSILNYSESKSVQKKLRKPEAMLPEVLTGGKVYLRNVIDNVKAVAAPLTGRVNGDTILLKIT